MSARGPIVSTSLSKPTRTPAGGAAPKSPRDEVLNPHSGGFRAGPAKASSPPVSSRYSFEWATLVISTLVKVLLFPCYHSTDFEVHRNWLAITYSLPIRDWYFEATSQWTLDYPPFFAYFSWLLAQPAAFVDPLIVSIHEGLEYAEWPCKAYMRATVVATELVLAAALLAHSRFGDQRKVKLGYHDDNNADDRPSSRELGNSTHGLGNNSSTNGVSTGKPGLGNSASGPSTSQLLAASLLMHPGLIIIDHIHFQYNGFLFGVLAWSLWAAREDRPLLCAFLFSSLLNLKHIYVYIAPPFLVYLLRSYVFPVGSSGIDLSRAFERLLTVGVVTLVPFGMSLVPLALDGLRHEVGPIGVLSQMVSRLFPFSRGLIHAYWAPNAWALWTFGDRVLVKALQKLPILRHHLPSSFLIRYDTLAAGGFASASRGLVENISFGVLPDIRPSTCFVLTLTCCLVYMLRLWQTPTYRSFLASISLCGFASFLFGWHVHEKAIMLVLVPYTFLAAQDYAHMRTFVILSTAGIVSLFPLLYEAAETPIKIGYSLVWAILVFGPLQQRVYRPVEGNIGLLIHGLETIYLWGFLGLQLYVSVVHPLLFPAALVEAPTSTLADAKGSSFVSTTSAIFATKSALADPVSVVLDPAPALEAMSVEALTDSISSAIAATTSLETSATDAVEQAQAFIVVDGTSTPTEEYDEQPVTNSIDTLIAASPTASVSAPTPLSATETAESKSSEATPFKTDSSVTGSPTSPSSSSSMEFLPLMMVSVYCSIGVVWAWIRASALYLSQDYN
ncbi:hypothetical protein BCV70DRAFT_198832 [Testicularia cyperi]|uniref:Alpha-1,3-glucosyltransferase n=1 Tax=Testicularia cyperi TaxID=1882483 RepID=A0A317XTI5_9BASI|nr:hypothetical protein BCV70DRAFT_198832 [Testicularia cyperi]